MSNIYDLIQQKANNHEDPVPPDAWENIKKKKRKKRPGFFWILSCMLFFGLLIGGYLYFNRDTDTNTRNSISQADQLHAQPNNTTNDNQNKSKEPVQPANQRITTVTETTTSNAVITGGNEQVIQNNPVNNKQAQHTDNIQQSGKNNVSQTHKTGKKQKATAPGSYDGIVTGEPKKDHPANVARKKTIKKEKAKSSINTSQGETGELTNTQEDKKDSQETIAATPVDKQNEDLAGKAEKTPTLLPPLQVEKKLTTEPIQPEKAVTANSKNKKQDNAAKKSAGKHPWFIDFTITPVIPIQQHDEEIIFSRTLLLNGSRADFTGKLESSRIDPSIAFSISGGKEINKKFSASIGLQYLQLKEHVTIVGTQTNTYYKFIINQVNLDGGPGQMIDTVRLIQQGNRKFSAINSYRFLTIPVSVQYKVIQQQPWSLAVTAGVNINVYSRYNNAINLNPEAVLVNTTQTIPSTTGVSYSLAAGARIERRINKQFSVFGSPSFSYMLGKQPIKNTLFNTKIHQFGIGLGLSWKLK